MSQGSNKISRKFRPTGVHHLSRHQGWDEARELSDLTLLQAAQSGSVTFRCVEFSHMLQRVLPLMGVLPG
jgi:hypothetical protein